MELMFVRQGGCLHAARALRPEAKVAEWQERTAYPLELVHSEESRAAVADVIAALGDPPPVEGRPGWWVCGASAAEIAAAVEAAARPKITAAERRRLQADFRGLLGAVETERAGGGDAARLEADARARLAAWGARARSDHERGWVEMLERELGLALRGNPEVPFRLEEGGP